MFTPVKDLAFYGQYSTGVDGVGNLISLSETQLNYELATGRQYEVGVKQSFWNGLGAVAIHYGQRPDRIK